MIETTEFEQVTQIKMSKELGGKPVYWMSAYLVDGLLIDTGCAETSNELVSYLEGKELRQVVNTHYHEDHIGGNHDILARFGMDIYAHPKSIPLIESRPHLYPYQEFAFGYPVPTKVRPVSDPIKTSNYVFEIIETPGHSEDHICLFERSQGWCFTGDLFARVNPKFIRPEEHIGEIIKSMQKILDLPSDRLILFTSLGRIVEDGKGALSECISYLSGLGKKVKKLSAADKSVDEIVNELFGGEHPFIQVSDGQFSTANLVRSFIATT